MANKEKEKLVRRGLTDNRKLGSGRDGANEGREEIKDERGKENTQRKLFNDYYKEDVPTCTPKFIAAL